MEGQNIILNALTQQLLAKDKQIEMLLQTNAHLVDEIKNLVAERDAYLATGKTLPTKPQTQSTITTTTTTTKATSQGNKKRKLTDELEPSTPQKAVAASEKSQCKVATPPPPVLIDAEKSGDKAPKSPASQSESAAAAKKRKRKGSEAPTPQPSNGNEKSAKKNNTASTPTPEKPSADKAVQQQQKPPKKKKKAEPAAPERPVDVDKIKKQTKAKEGGLAWVDSVVGTGAVASPGKKLVVGYKGYLRNGKMFDESNEKGFAFRLGFNQVIAGWEKGLIGMRVGGKRKLVIPPQFAYGNKTLPQIPANSTLCFDIELLSVA